MGSENSDAKRELEKEASSRERFELLHHVSSLLEPVMVGLGLAFLVLLLLEFESVPIVIAGTDRLGDIMQTIWVIFLADFLLRFAIAPSKLSYLRSNWLGALSLALPFLRPLRAFRAARALRGVSLVRLLGGINRCMRALRRITRGRLMIYVAALTVAVVFAGASGVQLFERNYEDSPIQNFGDALWWSATLVTTMGSDLHVVSPEGRVIAFLQRLYALSIFGYITASIASYLICVDTSETKSIADAEQRALRDEVRELRRELQRLVDLQQSDVSPRQGPRQPEDDASSGAPGETPRG